MGVVDCHNMLMLLGGELRLSNHNLQDEYNGNGAKTIMTDDNTLMIFMMLSVQLPLIFQSYVPWLSLEGDDGRRTGRCDPPHDAGAQRCKCKLSKRSQLERINFLSFSIQHISNFA